MVYDAVSNHKSKMMSLNTFKNYIDRNLKEGRANLISSSDSTTENGPPFSSKMEVLPSFEPAYAVEKINNVSVGESQEQNNVDRLENFLIIKGWAVDQTILSPINNIILYLDNKPYECETLLIRDDVEKSFKNPKVRNCGFELKIPNHKIPAGMHSISLELKKENDSITSENLCQFKLTDDLFSPPPLVTIGTINDIPIIPEEMEINKNNNCFKIEGWSIDNESQKCVKKIIIIIDEEGYEAKSGLTRPDIVKSFNNNAYQKCGFELYLPNSEVPLGKHNLSIQVHKQDNSLHLFKNFISFNLVEPKSDVPIYCIDSLNGKSLNSDLKNEHIEIESDNYLYISGWAIDKSNERPVKNVYININGRDYTAEYNLECPQNFTSALNNANYMNCGFSLKLPSKDILPGQHTVKIKIQTLDNKTHLIDKTISLNIKPFVPGASSIFSKIEEINSIAIGNKKKTYNIPAITGSVNIKGYAIDNCNTTLFKKVWIVIDGKEFQVDYGWIREDIVTDLGNDKYKYCGFWIHVPNLILPLGDHNLKLKVIDNDGNSQFFDDIQINIFDPIEKFKNSVIKILENPKISNKEKLCLFAHFDNKNEIAEYVIDSVKKISDLGFNIIFTTTSEKIADSELKKISKYCSKIIIKENIGYDFGSWTKGFEAVEDINKYQELMLINDSFYGPLFDLAKVMAEMSSKYDMWGINDTYEQKYHIQSFFMVFNRKIIESGLLTEFFRSFTPIFNKYDLVKTCEVGLSQLVLDIDLKIGAYCQYDKILKLIKTKYPKYPHMHQVIKKYVNPTHFFWKILIEDFNCPILKIELLKKNPSQIYDVDTWLTVVEKTGYPVELIKKHLNK